MPGVVKTLERPQRLSQWRVDPAKATTFERLIGHYLKQTTATTSGAVKVFSTPTSGDRGRDYEIHASQPIELFGIPFFPDSEEVAIYVECKSTTKQRLDDSFLSDASQHVSGKFQHYLLVTNATITPYTHYRAERIWQALDARFWCVDGEILLRSLQSSDLEEKFVKEGIPLPDHYADTANTLPVCWQEEHLRENGRERVELFLTISNLRDESVHTALHISTDVLWEPRSDSVEVALERNETRAFKLVADRRDYRKTPELSLTIAIDGRSQKIRVATPSFRLKFEPPFVGKEHQTIARRLQEIIESADIQLINITGPAGVGKSRVIREGLRPLRGGLLDSYTFYFGKEISETYRSFLKDIKTDLSVDDENSWCESVIRSATRANFPVAIVFEDLHHATAVEIESLTTSITDVMTSRPSIPLIIVTTGRDDHTFPNDDYFSFLEYWKLESHHGLVSIFEVPPMEDDDAVLLTKTCAKGLPSSAVSHIVNRSENNPFYIIEFLQYLLDTKLATLLNRRTIGVLDAERFKGEEALPPSVNELYRQRIKSLREAGAVGEAAFNFLTTASFFGFSLERSFIRPYFDGEDSYEVWDLLVSRRFVVKSPTGLNARFSHENLLQHLRSSAESSQQSKLYTEDILNRPSIFELLSDLEQGRVLSLAGRYGEGLKKLNSVWKVVQKVTNFSSEALPKEYFGYLRFLFRCALNLELSPNDIAKVVLAYCYMGIHNYSIYIGLKACNEALEMLEDLYGNHEIPKRYEFSVRQLRAHGLQNMGHTTEAAQEMLELSAEIESGISVHPSVTFDLYDRLQEYYRKMNHRHLAEHYGAMAGKSVSAAKDQKLIAAHLITKSVAALCLGRAEALNAASEAMWQSKKIGVHRFVTYCRLTELIARTIYDFTKQSGLMEIRDETKSLLKEAVSNSFGDSIMRAELLLATLCLYTYSDEEEACARALFLAKSGQDNSIRFGNGLFDWAFDNLILAVYLRQDRNDELVRRRAATCLERLQRRGLTFVGAQSGTYPNYLAISNILRFYARFHESVAAQKLRDNVRAYDLRFLRDPSYCMEIISQAAGGEAVLGNRSEVSSLRFPVDSGYFTPVF